MLQIRKYVFETNSSSMHCIAIGRCSLVRPKEVYVNLEEIYNLLENWEYEMTSCYDDKASYLIYCGADKSVLAKVIKDFCEADLYVNDSKVYPSDLDAQVIVDQVKLPFINNENDIIEFIFNTAYIIYVGSDNGDFEGIEHDDNYNILSINGDRVVYQA